MLSLKDSKEGQMIPTTQTPETKEVVCAISGSCLILDIKK
jgi:hypothetical protein